MVFVFLCTAAAFLQCVCVDTDVIISREFACALHGSRRSRSLFSAKYTINSENSPALQF